MNMTNLKKYATVFGLMIILSLFVIVNYQVNKEKALTVDEAAGQIIKETKPASPIGNISYHQTQKDATINTIIDSSQLLDNGNLLVKFHHNSNKEELYN